MPWNLCYFFLENAVCIIGSVLLWCMSNSQHVSVNYLVRGKGKNFPFKCRPKVMLYNDCKQLSCTCVHVMLLVRYVCLPTWTALIETMTAEDSWACGHHILLPPKHGPQLPSIPHGHNSTTPKPGSRNNSLFMCWKWSRMGLQSESAESGLDTSRGILFCVLKPWAISIFLFQVAQPKKTIECYRTNI